LYAVRVRYREHSPPPCLAPLVTCFWEITDGAGSHRVLPDGAMDVLFARGDDRASVIGPMTRALVTDVLPPGRSAAAWIVGVRFRPGAAGAMLGISARELRDDAVDAGLVWGPSGRTLGARLADARDATMARATLEAELVGRVRSASAPDARVQHVVAMLWAARGELPVPAVAASVDLGERQLERLFEERVGYGPKTFARVARLQRAVDTIAQGRGTTMSWASFARTCGYADQAHLIREFRALTGVTPRVYAMSEIDNPSSARVRTVAV
jgi:AraC-like DNA-binding protein